MKENFYDAKSMMKSISQGLKKFDICPSFYMLYYLENINLIECITYGHALYKLRTGRGRTLVTHRKLRYFSITPRLQKLFMFS